MSKGPNACFGFGKMDQKIKDYPSAAKKEGDNHHRPHILYQFQVGKVLMLPSKIGFMLFRLMMNKRVLTMWLPVC